ncbi:hypothetical protein CWI38_0051p0030 [Hamiltosporidium tvaerminnensis]|uniref:Uncharacterized protein n=2 Tax=Hamiltosporidium TaxID=1176354 RepID=A0A4Q9LLD6_9MICR|nr:hypothetical protein CWI36_0101p0010 [Hamiltosporidium magnivora]TBU09530.1 hypothetical protein CWI39_0064p0060 [Hamiltosporidium magnivora]TBU20488.1 hypothetical protein CWI38_0063p0040 [Hamiltosporidium tvaerminnensis]TBU20558.1 hypothetical protein CWI38_0051p0030 [Hamiltosporidium tvaerminnensis]
MESKENIKISKIPTHLPKSNILVLIWQDVGSLYSIFGDHKKSIHSYERALQQNERNAIIWYKICVEYIILSNYELAIKNSYRLKEFDSNGLYFNTIIGHIYLKKGDIKKSYLSFEAAVLSKNEIDPFLAYSIGLFYESVGLFDIALKLFSKSLKKYFYHDFIVDLVYRTGVMVKVTNSGYSIRVFSVLLRERFYSRLEKKSIKIQIAHLLVLIGKYKDALDLITDILKIDQRYIFALRLRCYIFYKMNDLVNAEHSCVFTIRDLGVGDAYIWYILGLCKRESGNFEAALDHLVMSSRKDTNNWWLWNTLGILYSKIGQYSEAEKSFNSAIKTNPLFSEADYNLNILRTGNMASGDMIDLFADISETSFLSAPAVFDYPTHYHLRYKYYNGSNKVLTEYMPFESYFRT